MECLPSHVLELVLQYAEDEPMDWSDMVTEFGLPLFGYLDYPEPVRLAAVDRTTYRIRRPSIRTAWDPTHPSHNAY